jgi:hemerythrin-like domain-containing protein
MDPIEILMNEHRRIEAGLDALDAWVGRLQAGSAPPLSDLRDFVRFIQAFADRTHHGKEEDILFEVMVREGFPREGGPIAVMLMEHDEGRAHVKVLAEAAEAGAELSGEALDRVAAAGHGYTGLLRAHIQKEDQILYPMARAQLSPAAYEEAAERCRAYEDEHVAEKSELMALGERLAQAYRS